MGNSRMGGLSLTVRNIGAVEKLFGESGVIGDRDNRDERDRLGNNFCNDTLLLRRVGGLDPEDGLWSPAFRFGLELEYVDRRSFGCTSSGVTGALSETGNGIGCPMACLPGAKADGEGRSDCERRVEGSRTWGTGDADALPSVA